MKKAAFNSDRVPSPFLLTTLKIRCCIILEPCMRKSGMFRQEVKMVVLQMTQNESQLVHKCLSFFTAITKWEIEGKETLKW